jgi:Rrf2 family transcriptional regulator, iron-sulfur cluster assembly transcription factor
MLTLTGEYALRASVHMATLEENRFFLARDIAEATGIPGAYLAKIMQSMVKDGLLLSQRGLRGGFRFSRPLTQISIADVIGSVENLIRYEQCILGQAECTDKVACPLHYGWREIANRYLDWMRRTKLSEMGRK